MSVIAAQLTEVLDGIWDSKLPLDERKRLAAQAVGRALHGAKGDPPPLLHELEEALDLVGKLGNGGTRPSISKAKALLREKGGHQAASKLSRLSKGRNLMGHPVVGLQEEVAAAFGGKVADATVDALQVEDPWKSGQRLQTWGGAAPAAAPKLADPWREYFGGAEPQAGAEPGRGLRRNPSQPEGEPELNQDGNTLSVESAGNAGEEQKAGGLVDGKPTDDSDGGYDPEEGMDRPLCELSDRELFLLHSAWEDAKARGVRFNFKKCLDSLDGKSSNIKQCQDNQEAPRGHGVARREGDEGHRHDDDEDEDHGAPHAGCAWATSAWRESRWWSDSDWCSDDWGKDDWDNGDSWSEGRSISAGTTTEKYDDDDDDGLRQRVLAELDQLRQKQKDAAPFHSSMIAQCSAV